MNLSIKDVKISFNEKILAVSLYINPKKKSVENPRIEIYNLMDNDNCFELLKVVDSLSSSIEFIDFSVENYYLMYRDIEKNVVYIRLTDMKKFDKIDSNHKIEWLNEGIKLSRYKNDLNNFYNENNSVTCLLKYN